jgi:hypothetical protein
VVPAAGCVYHRDVGPGQGLLDALAKLFSAWHGFGDWMEPLSSDLPQDAAGGFH